MRWFVTVADRTYTVDIEGDDVQVDGQRVQADLQKLGDSLHQLLLDGRAHTFVPEQQTPGSWQIHTAGMRYAVVVVDERTRAIRELVPAAAAPRGPRSMRAPMPGLIVRVDVTAGDEVRTGEGVVIIEAMKMENELRADGGGIVSRVLVEAGQAVEKGAVLVEFEEAS